MKKIIAVAFIIASIFTACLIGSNLSWKDALYVSFKDKHIYSHDYRPSGYYNTDACDEVKVRNFFNSVSVKYCIDGEWREFNFFAEKGTFTIIYK